MQATRLGWCIALFPACVWAQLPLPLTPDPAFGSAGISRAQLPAAFETLAVSSEDATYVYTLSVEDTVSEPAHYLTRRLVADGSLDGTFGTGGTLAIAPLAAAGEQRFFGLCTDPASGAILLVGGSSGAGNEGFDVVRLLADGSPDAAWDGDGHARIVVADGTPAVFACAVQPDGKLVVGGADGATDAEAAGVTNYAFTARLTTAAALDPDFNSTGVRRFVPFTASPQPYFKLTRVAQGLSGTLLFGGHAQTAGPGPGDLVLAKLSSAGGFISLFGGDGVASLASDGQLSLLRQQSSGNLMLSQLVLGSGPAYGVFVRRVTIRGLLDLTYGCTGGKAGESQVENYLPFDGSADADGRLLLIGRETVGMEERESVVRIAALTELTVDGGLGDPANCSTGGGGGGAPGPATLGLLALAALARRRRGGG